MDKDENGVYHASADAWQQIGGYNSFYDAVFAFGTSMSKESFEFAYEGQDYVLWGWKGDYINLGAGAELGIYKRMTIFGNDTEHWLVDKSLSMPMTMTVQDNKGNVIVTYNPSEPQWWITSFNPEYKNVDAGTLSVSITVDFSENPGMFNAFYEEWSRSGLWTFDQENNMATLCF